MKNKKIFYRILYSFIFLYFCSCSTFILPEDPYDEQIPSFLLLKKEVLSFKDLMDQNAVNRAEVDKKQIEFTKKLFPYMKILHMPATHLYGLHIESWINYHNNRFIKNPKEYSQKSIKKYNLNNLDKYFFYKVGVEYCYQPSIDKLYELKVDFDMDRYCKLDTPKIKKARIEHQNKVKEENKILETLVLGASAIVSGIGHGLSQSSESSNINTYNSNSEDNSCRSSSRCPYGYNCIGKLYSSKGECVRIKTVDEYGTPVFSTKTNSSKSQCNSNTDCPNRFSCVSEVGSFKNICVLEQ